MTVTILIRSFTSLCLLSAPWLIGSLAGPVAQLGAWWAATGALAGILFFQSTHYWLLSLVWAGSLSMCVALLQFAGGAVELTPWVTESLAGEMVANLRQRNQFATLMAVGGLAVWLSFERKAAGHMRTWWLNAMYGGMALFAFSSALSGSRTGLLQWLALWGLAWVWRSSLSKAQLGLLSAAGVSYLLGVCLAPWLSELAGHANVGLIGRVDDSNAFSRLALWSNVWELIMREPWIGHGWRSLAYAHYSTNFSGPRFMELLDNAHNLPLHLAVELGLPVALGFCSLVAWLLWKNQPWKETRPQRQLAWGVLLVIGIHSMVEYPLWYGPFFMTTMICVGILAGDAWQKWLLSHSRSAQSAIIFGVRGFGVLLLLGTAYVAFDYHRVSQIYLTDAQRSTWYAADPLGAAKQSVLFQNHAKFAELQITPLTRESAARVLELSAELVRWSPEPRIIEKLIESSVMMGQDDLAAFHLKHYKLAYPAAHASWIKSAL